MPASTILLLETDPAAGTSIEAILTGAGYTVTQTSNPAEAVSQAAAHQVVIVDVVDGDRTALAICVEIRAVPAATAVPVMCIGATDDVEERIRFLEAGADDVMARPFDARELEARVEALLLRFQRSRELVPAIATGGVAVAKARRTVAVYSPKGGVGTTTIATNIAVSAATKRRDQVALVDLDLQFGGVATHLNLRPRHTIGDVVRDETAIREPELIRTYMTHHESGLHVLAAPAAPDASESVTPAHVSRILTTLLEAYQLVVIDAGSALDERTLIAFDTADTILLPVYPEIAALKAMHALLEYTSETGAVGSKAMFILNNVFARDILRLRDVENALGTKVGLELPYDPFIYLKAINEGIPVVIGAPRSAAAEQLVKLSNSVFGEDGLSAAQPSSGKKSGGGLFRRGR